MALGFSSRRARAIASTGTLAALLALSACNSPSEPAADNGATTLNDGYADENLVDENVIDEATAEEVAVEEVPPVTSSTSSTDSAAVTAAAATAAAITADTGITRVRHGDGWAWQRDGKIIRTASRDGKQVAYFRTGEDAPYFVQKDGHGYSYEGGKVRGVVDRSGKSAKPDAARSREAEQAAEQARRQRDEAKNRADKAPSQAQSDRSDRDRTATSDRQGNDRPPQTQRSPQAERGPTPRATATPSRTQPTANQRGDRATALPRGSDRNTGGSGRGDERRDD